MGISIERDADEVTALAREVVKNALAAVYALEIARQRAVETLHDAHEELVATSADAPSTYILIVEREIEALAARLETDNAAQVIGHAREIEALIDLAVAHAGVDGHS